MIDFSNPHFHHAIVKRIIWNENYQFNQELLLDSNNSHLHEECQNRIKWLNEHKYKAPPWYRGPNWQDWIEQEETQI